jgi:DNA invertase Pin-like site-specific DNA recombinase
MSTENHREGYNIGYARVSTLEQEKPFSSELRTFRRATTGQSSVEQGRKAVDGRQGALRRFR